MVEEASVCHQRERSPARQQQGSLSLLLNPIISIDGAKSVDPSSINQTSVSDHHESVLQKSPSKEPVEHGHQKIEFSDQQEKHDVSPIATDGLPGADEIPKFSDPNRDLHQLHLLELTKGQAPAVEQPLTVEISQGASSASLQDEPSGDQSHSSADGTGFLTNAVERSDDSEDLECKEELSDYEEFDPFHSDEELGAENDKLSFASEFLEAHLHDKDFSAAHTLKEPRGVLDPIIKDDPLWGDVGPLFPWTDLDADEVLKSDSEYTDCLIQDYGDQSESSVFDTYGASRPRKSLSLPDAAQEGVEADEKEGFALFLTIEKIFSSETQCAVTGQDKDFRLFLWDRVLHRKVYRGTFTTGLDAHQLRAIFSRHTTEELYNNQDDVLEQSASLHHKALIAELNCRIACYQRRLSVAYGKRSSVWLRQEHSDFVTPLKHGQPSSILRKRPSSASLYLPGDGDEIMNNKKVRFSAPSAQKARRHLFEDNDDPLDRDDYNSESPLPIGSACQGNCSHKCPTCTEAWDVLSLNGWTEEVRNFGGLHKRCWVKADTPTGEETLNLDTFTSKEELHRAIVAAGLYEFLGRRPTSINNGRSRLSDDMSCRVSSKTQEESRYNIHAKKIGSKTGLKFDKQHHRTIQIKGPAPGTDRDCDTRQNRAPSSNVLSGVAKLFRDCNVERTGGLTIWDFVQGRKIRQSIATRISSIEEYLENHRSREIYIGEQDQQPLPDYAVNVGACALRDLNLKIRLRFLRVYSQLRLSDVGLELEQDFLDLLQELRDLLEDEQEYTLYLWDCDRGERTHSAISAKTPLELERLGLLLLEHSSTEIYWGQDFQGVGRTTLHIQCETVLRSWNASLRELKNDHHLALKMTYLFQRSQSSGPLQTKVPDEISEASNIRQENHKEEGDGATSDPLSSASLLFEEIASIFQRFPSEMKNGRIIMWDRERCSRLSNRGQFARLNGQDARAFHNYFLRYHHRELYIGQDNPEKENIPHYVHEIGPETLKDWNARLKALQSAKIRRLETSGGNKRTIFLC